MQEFFYRFIFFELILLFLKVKKTLDKVKKCDIVYVRKNLQEI